MAWNAGFARRLRSAGSVSSNLNKVPAARLGILRTLLGGPVVPGGHGARNAYRRNHPSAPLKDMAQNILAAGRFPYASQVWPGQARSAKAADRNHRGSAQR